jgi:S-adenosylmethionine-diacylglycerol 3-amino-3-carboxypropyl transferase
MQSLLKLGYDAWFKQVHNSGLLYNICWEDPRIDRQLMQIDSDSRIVMITSAGCNALDYLLDGALSVDCIDINPWQGALLELKIAAIKSLPYQDFFRIFGEGAHPEFPEIYYQHLRPQLHVRTAELLDAMVPWFSPQSGRKSFYFYSTAGDVAWSVRRYLRWVRPKTFAALARLLEAKNLDTQRTIYAELEGGLWNVLTRWMVRQPFVLSKLGVPRAQRNLIERDFPNGVNDYIEQKLRHVFTELPIADNYFWRLYLTGQYTQSCSPNYLKRENFFRLRESVNRIQVHECYFSDFLEKRAMDAPTFTHYVLLDHQDWLFENAPSELEREWRLILGKASPKAKVLMRSAGRDTNFLPEFVSEYVDLRSPDALHIQDRVGTYGCTMFGALRS